MRYLLRPHAFLLICLGVLLSVFLVKTHTFLIADWGFSPNLPTIRFGVNCDSPQVSKGSTPDSTQSGDSTANFTCSGTLSIKLDQFVVGNCSSAGSCNSITWTNSNGGLTGTISPGGSVTTQLAASGSTTITARVRDANTGNISFYSIAIINFSPAPPPAASCPGHCGNNTQPVPQMSDGATCTAPWTYTPGDSGGNEYDTWCQQQAQGAQYPYCWTCTPVPPAVIECPNQYCGNSVAGGLPGGVCVSPNYWEWYPGPAPGDNAYDQWCAANRQPLAYCYKCVVAPTPPPANACTAIGGTCGNETSPTEYCNGYWSWYNDPTLDAGCAAQSNGKDYCYDCIGNPPPPPPPPTYNVQGRIYIDIDHSGTQNIPPDGIGGQWSIYARNTATNNVYNATTPGYPQSSNPDGYYTIGGMPAGTYQVIVEKRPNYCFTTRNNYATISVPRSQALDFGVAPLHTLSGNWFVDLNRDGIKNTAGSSPAAPAPIAGATADSGYAGSFTVQTLNSGTIPGVFASADGNANCTTFTTSSTVNSAATGDYSVRILPGDFRISATAPAGNKFNFVNRSGSIPTSAVIGRDVSTGVSTPPITVTENLAMSPFWLRGLIFVDYDLNGVFNGIDKYWTSTNSFSPAISIGISGAATGSTTNSLVDSSYFVAFPTYPGSYTVQMTDPSGYTSNYPLARPNPKSVVNPTNDLFEDFSVAPPYFIEGYVFNDRNKNEQYNSVASGGVESGVGIPPAPAGGFRIDVTRVSNGAVTTVYTDSAGHYITPPLQIGQYTVTWNTTATPIPAGFVMTVPRNTNPPSWTVYVDAPPPGLCNKDGSLDAYCLNGIKELNFGITNEFGWVQGRGGDMRVDIGFQSTSNGFIDPIPQGSQYTGPVGGNIVVRQNIANSHGVLFTDGQTFNFCSGNITGRCQASASVNQWIVGQAGGSPNKFGARGGRLQTSHKTISEKLALNGITPIDLDSRAAGNCGNVSGCSLTSMNRGVYSRTGMTYIRNSNINGNGNIIVLIDGDLRILGNIDITTVNITAVFIVSGNITIAPSVGDNETNLESHLEGFYSVDGAFIIPSLSNNTTGIGAGVCTATGLRIDNRLNIRGAVVVNAAQSTDPAKRFINYRTLCISDLSYPSVFIDESPELILYLPEIIKKSIFYGQEVAP